MIIHIQERIQYWKLIRQYKQTQIDYNKNSKNNRSLDYDYQIGHQILIIYNQDFKHKTLYIKP